jgi:hypothetical protein
MAKAIRCVKNCYLVSIDKNGQEKEQRFVYGRWYRVDHVERIDEEYINVIFEDGSAIAGIQKSIFEMGNAPIVPAPEPIEKVQEVEEIPPVEKLDKPIALPVDIIGNQNV